MSKLRLAWLKVGLFLLCLAPLSWNLTALVFDWLGANPAEQLIRNLGWWALVLLLVTLLVTPLRQLLDLVWLVRLRRMLGLFCFFYASLHLLSFTWLDLDFRPDLLAQELSERPYITVGFAGWLLLLLLALTSNRWSIQRLGRNWKRLHRSIYAVSVLALVHLFWLTRADFREPLLFLMLVGLLLGYRLVRASGLSLAWMHASEKKIN